MKNKTKAKLSIKIISIISFIAIVFICHSYGFLQHCTKLFDKDFRNVYGIVCKNTDIRFQRVKLIGIRDESIGIYLKRHTIPYEYLGFDPHPSDFYSAVNIYRELSTQFKGKTINVYTGASGSGDYVFEFMNDKVWIDNSYSIYTTESERMLTFSEVLSSVIHIDNINEIRSDFIIDSVTDELPVNYNIDSFRCLSDYTGNFSAISSFQGLKHLEIYFISDENNNSVNMAFLNNLTNLEDLTLYTDCNYIDMTGAQNLTLKQFTLHTDSYTEEFENQLICAFPNAEISIVSDH